MNIVFKSSPPREKADGASLGDFQQVTRHGLRPWSDIKRSLQMQKMRAAREKRDKEKEKKASA